MTISFDYEPWDLKRDVPLNRPGTTLALSVLKANINVGRTPSKRGDRRDSTIGPTIDGMTQLLAGALEWFRQYGYGAVEVQQLVTAYLEKEKGTPVYQRYFDNRMGEATRQISDPRNIVSKLNPEKVVSL